MGRQQPSSSAGLMLNFSWAAFYKVLLGAYVSASDRQGDVKSRFFFLKETSGSLEPPA